MLPGPESPQEKILQVQACSPFFLGLRTISLRLGPLTVREAVEEIAKGMKRLGFMQRGRSMEKKKTKTRQHSDDTQMSRPDLRFASRESSELRAGGHNSKNPHQDCKPRFACQYVCVRGLAEPRHSQTTWVSHVGWPLHGEHW